MREAFRSAQILGNDTVRAVFDLESTSEGAAWLHMLPAGPSIAARDGRAFRVSNLRAVIAASRTPMLVDWEHESEMFRGSTKAAGWIETFEAQDGPGRHAQPGLWGRVSWTAEGARDVAAKAYRYLSPVLLIDKESSEVLRIESLALTNKPALELTEIQAFREKFSMSEAVDPVHRELLSRGLSMQRIRTAEEYLREQAERLRGVPRNLSPFERLRERCMRNGMTPFEYERATKYLAEQRQRRGA